MTDLEHLIPAAAKALDLPLVERIAFIQKDRWIGYPRAQAALKKLERLYNYPRVTRMPHLLLVGETNSGKSTIGERFANGKAQPEDDDGPPRLGVLMIKAPPEPEEDRLYTKLANRLNIVFKDPPDPDKLAAQVAGMMHRLGTRMLILDEIQHAIAGSGKKQQVYLNSLKNFGDDYKFNIVGLGVYDSLNAVQTDPQLANRFDPLSLPRWRLEDEEFEALLVSFESVFPLRHPSNLDSTETREWLHAMSEGLIGELSNLLKLAAETAVESGLERITLELLQDLDWTPPSERREKAVREAFGGFQKDPPGDCG